MCGCLGYVDVRIYGGVDVRCLVVCGYVDVKVYRVCGCEDV